MEKKYSKTKALQFIAMTLGSFVTFAILSKVLPIQPIHVAFWPPVLGLIFVVVLNAGNKKTQVKR